VLVVLDSLRKDHVGAYGNPWIQTPHLDAFARESVPMTRAYPESLPTLCVRRALHTGLRTYPYRGHRELKGDFLGVAPGWGPIPEEQDTIAELLAGVGYWCALISDLYHMFKPSKNFHRGFHEWHWVRGQEADRYRSGPDVPEQRVARHMTGPPGSDPALARFLATYLANTADRRQEADYFPARVFSEAARWIDDNRTVARHCARTHRDRPRRASAKAHHEGM
jgi:arylsulfatase A-like enzyme